MKGTVIAGEGIARKLGYPTVNLDIPLKKVQLHDGVYAAKAVVRSLEYQAALVVQRSLKKVEVHLVGYEGPSLYGAVVEVTPIQKISEIETKESDVELKEKMAQDITQIMEVLRSV